MTVPDAAGSLMQRIVGLLVLVVTKALAATLGSRSLPPRRLYDLVRERKR